MSTLPVLQTSTECERDGLLDSAALTLSLLLPVLQRVCVSGGIVSIDCNLYWYSMESGQERTWLLSIHVTDLSVEKTLRVSGDLHVGGVMFKLVESLGK